MRYAGIRNGGGIFGIIPRYRAAEFPNRGTGGMSDDDIVQTIFELRLKMNGLMDWAKNAGRSDLSSLRALDEKAHVIHYSTLQSNIHAERMSIGNQKALAKAFGFKVDWREWRDPDARRTTAAHKRRDRAEAFLERFISSKSPGVHHPIEDSGHTASSTQSVAPRRRLARELDRVATSSQNLVAEITRKTNFEIGDEFPKQRLIDIAVTLTGLAAGSEDGALPALEYAEAALNDIRFSCVEIADGDALPDFGRGGRVDQALGTLISDVGTAKRFYSQSKLDAAAKSQTPDHVVAAISADQRKVADRAQAISKAGFAVAGDLDKSAKELAAQHDPDHVAADNLSRKSWDVANLARQEGIEITSPRPRVAWLEKLESGVTQALRGVELAAGLGEIAITKIGGVLINHVTDWFKGAREFAEESRALIASLKKKWQAENDADKPGPRVARLPRDLDITPPMIVVSAGEFMMGSPSGEGHGEEHPQHKVMIKNRFEVGIAPITRGEFASFIDATNYMIDERPDRSWRNPGFDQEDDHPVVCVNWHEAQAYVAWLRKQSSGKAYRLLSEAEWEYCCRAGTTSAYSTGESITPAQANFGLNAKGTTSVFKFPPNAFGLRDLHGNVWEWCEDNWHRDYSGNPPTDGSVWRGGDTSFCVLRGGSWFDYPQILRSAYRERSHLRLNIVGVRVARTL
jgi:formylglycine-generating enzyme required for sulfatase activity